MLLDAVLHDLRAVPEEFTHWFDRLGNAGCCTGSPTVRDVNESREARAAKEKGRVALRPLSSLIEERRAITKVRELSVQEPESMRHVSSRKREIFEDAASAILRLSRKTRLNLTEFSYGLVQICPGESQVESVEHEPTSRDMSSLPAKVFGPRAKNQREARTSSAKTSLSHARSSPASDSVLRPEALRQVRRARVGPYRPPVERREWHDASHRVR